MAFAPVEMIAESTDGPRPEIIVGEPGLWPLAAFGHEASDAFAELLTNAQISFYSGCEIRDQNGPLRLHTSAGDLRPDLIVTVPRITGPNVRGIPGEAMDRFLHVDERCRVIGAGGRISGGPPLYLTAHLIAGGREPR